MSDEQEHAPIRIREMIPKHVPEEPNTVLRELDLGARAKWEGDQFVIPGDLQPGQALTEIHSIVSMMSAHLEPTCVQRYFDWPFEDVVVALDKVLKREFDLVTVPRGESSMRTIQIGLGEEKRFETGNRRIGDLGDAEVVLFNAGGNGAMHIHARQEYGDVIDTIFEVIEKEIRENSIYRGKAIDGSLNFVDLSGVSRDDVVYNTESHRDLLANLWGFLTRTAQMRRLGMSLKRSTLLSGTYGTGKTMTGTLSGQIAVDNGFTFIWARPGEDSLYRALELAEMYQPALIFFEDIDTVVSSDPEELRELLDKFDGLDAKSNEIIMLMTTNHPDKLVKGQIRPGRMDAHIILRELDAEALEKLVRKIISPEMLAGDINFEEFFSKASEMSPAFAGEAIRRAVLYALIDQGEDDDDPVIGLDDLISGVDSIAEQIALMEAAGHIPEADRFEAVMSGVVGDSLTSHRVQPRSGRIMEVASNGH